MPTPKPLPKTVCEFFAGIGLVRAGLEAGGWQCVYANDIDPKKREMYVARFGGDHFHLGDVWDTATVTALIPGRPALATASFPCVDLSLAGHWRGLGGEHSSAFFGFTAALRALGPRRPPLVLVENVLGFLTSCGGADFASATNELADLGYWLDAFVLDAKFFVPQSRPRVFVVGIDCGTRGVPFVATGRRTLFGDADSNRPADLEPATLRKRVAEIRLSTGWVRLPLPAPKLDRRPLADSIDLDDRQDWWDAPAVEKHAAMMSDAHRAEVARLQATGDRHVGTIYRRIRHGATRAEVRFDGLAGCLRTPRGGSARQIIIVVCGDELRMRWMSPREYARLQGADDFPLVPRTTQNLHGFGDAVCVPVVEWIDRFALTPLVQSLTATAAA